MDFQRVFNYIFKDESWIVKLLIAAGLVLTGIGSIAVYGWMMAIIRCTASDEDCGLPEWDDFGTYFVDGLKAIGVYLIWSLPIIVLTFIVMFVAIFATFDMPTEEANLIVSMVSLVFSLIVMIISIPLVLLGMPAMALLAHGHSFGHALDPRNAWKVLKADFGSFLIAGAIYMFCSGIFNLAGFLLCCVGVYLTTAISLTVWSTMIGQAYKNAQEKLT